MTDKEIFDTLTDETKRALAASGSVSLTEEQAAEVEKYNLSPQLLAALLANYEAALNAGIDKVIIDHLRNQIRLCVNKQPTGAQTTEG